MDRRARSRLWATGWLLLSLLALVGAWLAKFHGRDADALTTVAAFAAGWWAMRLLNFEG